MEVVRLSRELRNHLLLLSIFLLLPAAEGIVFYWAHTGQFLFRAEWIYWPLVVGVPLIWLAQRSAKLGRAMAITAVILGFAWCLWNHQRAARQGDIILSLWTWIKFALIIAWSLRAWKLWNASYLRSEKRWFEGLPRGIPNLACKIKNGAKPAKVNRIDRHGLVVFEVAHLTEDLLNAELELELSHQASAKKFSCIAQVMSRQKTPLVLGLKFKDLSADQQKDLGDFVEKLKGEGYEDLNLDA